MTTFSGTTLNGDQVGGLPCAGPLTSTFGARDIPDHASGHTGNDIAAPDGTPVCAPAAGVVRFVSVNDGSPWAQVFGNSVILDHGDVVTLYGHMRDTPIVVVSERVAVGAQLGVVGNTGESYGSHLHWGMAPASNPWLQREGLGGLFDALSYIAPPAAEQPAPSDHAARPDAPDARYLGLQIAQQADVILRAVDGGAPLVAVKQIAQAVADDAAAIIGAA